MKKTQNQVATQAKTGNTPQLKKIYPMFPFRAMQKYPDLKIDEPLLYAPSFGDAKAIAEDLGGGFSLKHPLDKSQVSTIVKIVGSKSILKAKVLLELHYNIGDISNLKWPEILVYLGKIKQDDNWGELSKPSELSRPMSKNRMRTALDIEGDNEFNTYAKKHGLISLSRKLHQICMDKMSDSEKDKLRKA